MLRLVALWALEVKFVTHRLSKNANSRGHLGGLFRGDCFAHSPGLARMAAYHCRTSGGARDKTRERGHGKDPQRQAEAEKALLLIAQEFLRVEPR